jgi:hypothetical protein
MTTRITRDKFELNIMVDENNNNYINENWDQYIIVYEINPVSETTWITR